MRSGDAWIGGTKYAKTIRNQTPATALTHTHTSTSQGENERIGLRPPGYAKWGPPAAEAPLHVNTAIFAGRVCRSGDRRLGKFTLELYHNSNSEYWRSYNNYFVLSFYSQVLAWYGLVDRFIRSLGYFTNNTTSDSKIYMNVLMCVGMLSTDLRTGFQDCYRNVPRCWDVSKISFPFLFLL